MSRAPLFATSSDRLNAAVFDEWTAVHALTGVASAAMGVGGFAYIFGSVAYEVLEYFHESPRGSWIFGSKGPEWDVNMVSDVAVGALAYCFTAWALGRQPGHK